jgi:hypothetical protein
VRSSPASFSPNHKTRLGLGGEQDDVEIAVAVDVGGVGLAAPAGVVAAGAHVEGRSRAEPKARQPRRRGIEIHDEDLPRGARGEQHELVALEAVAGVEVDGDEQGVAAQRAAREHRVERLDLEALGHERVAHLLAAEEALVRRAGRGDVRRVEHRCGRPEIARRVEDEAVVAVRGARDETVAIEEHRVEPGAIVEAAERELLGRGGGRAEGRAGDGRGGERLRVARPLRSAGEHEA